MTNDTAAQAGSDDVDGGVERDLAAVLAEAARTINVHRTLEDTLGAIVHAARISVPGFDQVGISIVHRDGRIETMAATGELVWDLDRLQYDLDEGPCVRAMRGQPVVVAEDIRDDDRWPRFVPPAVELGLRSQLALQLYEDDTTLGGLNLYSTRHRTIDPQALATAEPFAAHAAIALGRARTESQLQEAAASRKMIGMAIGVVMERHRIDEGRALQYLMRVSSTSNTKLREVARAVVDAATHSYPAVPPDLPPGLPLDVEPVAQLATDPGRARGADTPS